MPLADLTNPKVIAFMLENYEKEARLRMAWRTKHLKQFERAATSKDKLKDYTHADIECALNVAGMATTTRDHAASTRHSITARPRVPDYLLAKVDSTRQEDPIMMPVSQETKELITESREYFMRRYKMSPDEKFNFPETGNWQYGWRLKESPIQAKGPAHPRVNRMASTMFSRVGMQPDPFYYGDPHQLIPSGICP